MAKRMCTLDWQLDLQPTGAQPEARLDLLVSCIMPTYNRRSFARRALEFFLGQDYLNKELVIVDDGDDAIGDLTANLPGVRYFRLPARASIGAKRNLACAEARGAIIVHWDDDDWMASWRLSYQVSNLLKEQADLCGLDKPLFYDPSCEQAWQYVYDCATQFWVYGATLCYRKSLWEENRFPDINVGEDTRFVWGSRSNRMLALQDTGFYVAMIHPGNTCLKQTSDARYHPYPTSEIKNLLGQDWRFYAELLRGDAHHDD